MGGLFFNWSIRLKPRQKPAPPPIDSKGLVRIYVDIPAEMARRFNILAATRGVPKRALMTDIVGAALAAAKV